MKSAPAIFVLAAAGLSAAKRVQKREIGGVLMCTGARATGICNYSVYQMDVCYNLMDPFYENTATFVPDGEAFFCYPYMDRCGAPCTSPTGCTMGAVSFDYINRYNLTATGWNQYIGHFVCRLNATHAAWP